VRIGTQTLSSATEMTLAIRPEKSEFAPVATVRKAEAATILGTIIEHLFHGDKLRTRIDIGLETPFQVDTQLKNSKTQGQLMAVGSRCQVSVDEASIVAFPGRLAS
jgi:hypothetical protein